MEDMNFEDLCEKGIQLHKQIRDLNNDLNVIKERIREVATLQSPNETVEFQAPSGKIKVLPPRDSYKVPDNQKVSVENLKQFLTPEEWNRIFEEEVVFKVRSSYVETKDSLHDLKRIRVANTIQQSTRKASVCFPNI